MGSEGSNNDRCSISNEDYYEELASAEEIYLEETEEELRVELLSLVPVSVSVSE